jgi:hypothetical protein
VGNYNVRINNICAVLLIIFFLIRFKINLVTLNRRIFFALFLLTFSVLLSFFFSPFKERCIVFFGWYIFTLLCYFLFPYFLLKTWDERKVLHLYGISYIFVGFYALLQLLFSCIDMQDPHATHRIWGDIVRPNAFAFEPSFYALYMTPFVFLCNYHYIQNRQYAFFIFNRLKFPHILLINLLYLVSTSTATIYAYLFFFFCMICVKSIRKKELFKFMLCFCITGCVLGLTFPYVVRTFFLKFFAAEFVYHHSFFQRWVGIVNAWKMFLQNPFFGVGLGGYPQYLLQAFLSGDSSFNYLVDDAIFYTSNPFKLLEPSNAFTEILASLGLFGVGAFCFFIAVYFSIVIRIPQTCQEVSHVYQKSRSQEKNERFNMNAKEQYIFKGGFIISVIVMLFVLQFNQGLLRTYVWVHFAIVFAHLENNLISGRVNRLNLLSNA